MKIKKFLIEAILGFILWTIALTPYMIIVVGVSMNQYISWLGMQAILVPIIAPFVFKITLKIEERLLK